MPWRRDRPPTPVFLGFPGGSAGKESACSAGDLGLIPGSGRSPGEGKGYQLQYSGLESSMDYIGSMGSQLSSFHFHSSVNTAITMATARGGKCHSCCDQLSKTVIQSSLVCALQFLVRFQLRYWLTIIYRVNLLLTIIYRVYFVNFRKLFFNLKIIFWVFFFPKNNNIIIPVHKNYTLDEGFVWFIRKEGYYFSLTTLIWWDQFYCQSSI